MQLLRCYIRPAELEIRAAEEHLRSDLDAIELKAQVLGRIEEWGARESEREELVGEVSAAMEARGYDGV